MRIAIVNDMSMAIEGLRRVIESTDIHQVAWTAFSGNEAVTVCRRDIPDLILMDIIMPGMNGVDTTREIMQSSPCPILLVTSSVNTNSALVFEAMGYGALDAINTPLLIGNSACCSSNPLLKKIDMLNTLTRPDLSGFRSGFTIEYEKKKLLTNHSLVAIGSSSGGPQALATILQSLPCDFHSPIVIVQHVDAQFASGLAEWLNTLSNIPVRIAREGDRPVAGTVFLAGSDHHLLLAKSGEFYYSENPRDMPYRPSVDVFWQSLEQHWKGKITVVLLTGMGRDGARSMLSLRQHGAYTIAQDKKTCAVYGMPKAAVDLNAAMDILPINDIAMSLLKKTNGSHSAGR